MLDLHSHILPEIDDGAESLEEALDMASAAALEGITIMAATPHCIEERDLKLYGERIKKRRIMLEEALSQRGIDIRIVQGAEVYIDPSILEADDLGDITINNTMYILVELPMASLPLYTEDFLYQLQLRGYMPILAHPERNRAIIENPDLLRRFIDLGALTQINTGSITGLFGSDVQKCARILLTHGMGHVLGTDAHSAGRRGPYMKGAAEQIRKWLDPDTAADIIFRTPRDIIGGRAVYPEPPREYKAKKNILQLLMPKGRV